MSQSSLHPPRIMSFDWARGIKVAWEDTPRWMFWKPAKRRLIIPPRVSSTHSLYEYQHPAFVAREALENYCAPTQFT